jgi:hypothetical protein
MIALLTSYNLLIYSLTFLKKKQSKNNKSLIILQQNLKINEILIYFIYHFDQSVELFYAKHYS